MVRLRGIPAADNAVGPVNLQVNGTPTRPGWISLEISSGNVYDGNSGRRKVRVLFDDLEGKVRAFPLSFVRRT